MSLAALLAYTDPNRQEEPKQPNAEGALAQLLAMTEPPPEPTMADRAKDTLLDQRDTLTSVARGTIDQGVLGTVAGATRVAGYGASGLVQGAKDASAQLGIGEAGARDWQIKKLETERDVLWGKRERQGTPFSDAERDRALAIEGELAALYDQQKATRPSAPAQALADATKAAGQAIDTSREGWRTALPVREKFAQSIPGQVVTGLGQAVGSLPAYLTGVGVPAGLAQAFDQGYQEAKAYKPDDEEGAVAAGLAVLPSGALDAAAEKFSLGPLLKIAQGAERTAALRGVARKLLETAKAAGSEGATEAAQQVWQNKVAQTSYDPTRKLGEGVPEAAAVGSIVGGGVHAGGQVLERLDTGRNVPESAATLRAQQADLIAGRRAVQMYPKGTGSELALPDGLARLETARGVFHYDPQQIDAETIQRKSAEGRENELLGLGSLSKADVGRRAQQTGEPIVAVTERSADGTERRSAVATTGTAAQTAREMRQMQAPGATIQVEPVGQTIVERLQAQRQEAEAGQAEATAREERRRTQARAEIAAKRARFDEALALARQTYANPARTYAEVQGALNRVRLYAEDASLGLDQMQREAARKATAALEQMERQMSPEQEALRERRQKQAEADAQKRAAVAAEQRALENKRWAAARRAGIGPDGKLDYNRLSDERLADMAQSGDATAEKLYMERQALPAESRGEELLAILPRVKLAFNDDALGGELKQLLFEEMTPGQRRKFADARGKGLDRAAEILREEYGFSKIQTPADLIDHISRALRGEDVRPDHVGGMDVEYAAASRRDPVTQGIDAKTLDMPVVPVVVDKSAWQASNKINRQKLLARDPQQVRNTQSGQMWTIDAETYSHSSGKANGPLAHAILASTPELAQSAVYIGEGKTPRNEQVLRLTRWLAAIEMPDNGGVAPVRITLDEMRDGSMRVYDVQPLAHKKTLPAQGPGLSDPVAHRKQRFFKVRDLLDNVKEDGEGAYQADFATGPHAPTMTSEAERERLLEAVRASAPALLKEYDLEAGFLDEVLRRYAGKHGQRIGPVPPEVMAAVARVDGSRGIIALSAKALESSDRAAGLLTHEIGHVYWQTLPEETRRILVEQHRREVVGRVGPLYRDGKLQSRLRYVEDASERGVKEWFAERIARLNEDWAKGRIDRAWRAGDLTLARLAQKLRDWVWKVWQALGRARGIDVDAELFQARFRDFWLSGDRSVGHRAGLAYAQEMATEALPQGGRITTRPGLITLRGMPTEFAVSAWHGTPHKVERFSTDKIGSGEGNQAFGWGLYFAENKHVASSYRSLRVGGRSFGLGPGPVHGIALILSARGEAEGEKLVRSAYAEMGPDLEDAIRAARQAIARNSHLYQVEIEAADTFIDWDKPLNEQPALVRQVAQKELARIGGSAHTGERFYRELVFQARQEGATEPMKAASLRLLELGVKGIRYMDGHSRTGDYVDQSSNFVVFDQELVKILRDDADISVDFATEAGEPSHARKAELLEQLRKGREQRDAGDAAGDLAAEQAGVAAVRRARETLDDEFPGWTEPTDDDDGRNLPPVPETQPAEASPFPVGDPLPPVRAEKTAAVYGDSAAELRWWEKPWRVVRDSLRGWKGAVPELPAFPAARWNAHDEFIQREGSHFYDRAKELYRVLVSSNDHIQSRAADQVDAVVGGLLKIPGGLDAEGYRRLGQLREMQRRAKAEGRALPAARLAEVSQLQASLEASPYVLFERLVLMLDYQWRATHLKDSRGEPITLPGGLNLSEVDAELKRLGQLVQASAHREAIERAVEQHVHTVRTVADDLRQRGLMMGDHLVNPYYFPHLTLEVSRNGKTEQRMLEPARVRPTTDADFRGYLVEPVGSKKPIETDYVRAMYYHLVQVGAHNLRADAVQNYAKPYDVRAKVEKRAQELSKARGTPVSWEQAFHEEFAPQGYVLYGTESGDAFPVVTIDRNRLAERIGHMLESTDLQDQLRELEVKGIKLLPEDLREIMQQGAREVWVMPARVAESLRGIAERADRQHDPEAKAIKWTLGLWKRNKLFMPQNHVRYEYGNLVADIEKVFSADPGMVRMMPRAAKEVREFYTTGKGSDLLRAALKEGVINSVTAQEMAQLRELPQFEALKTKGQTLGQQVGHRLSTLLMQPALLAADAATGGDFAHGLSSKSSVEISAMREAVFRYAKFLSDHQKITNGATPAYAGAYWRDIEAMGDSHEGAGDAAVRKAAAISRATFGDYGMLSVSGQWMRDKLIPFYSWIEVNFKYHANLLRNLRDQVQAGRISRGDAGAEAARALAVAGAGFTARAGAGFALRLMLPYVAVAIWNNTDDREELEDTLSAEDRRRFHIILGKDDEGRTRVVYGNTAFMDVMRWFSGPQFTQLATDYLAGRTDAATAFSAWKDGLIPDTLNNVLGGMGPVARVPAAVMAKKNFFPDVTDPKNIPAYDLRRTVLGMLTDDFTADVIERTVNKDYVAPKDMGDWARQLILQQRIRDPESWAYYAMRDKAADFLEQRTGQVRDTSYDAPDQQVLRNFRRAIYRGDAQTAMRMYSRALELGYTAERFAASVRAQDPLAALSKKDGLRREFVTTLSEFDRKQLQRAFQYYVRMDVMRGRERQLFPRDNMSPAMQARRAENPRFDLLQGLMEASMKAAEDDVRQRAERAQRRSLAPSRN